MTDATGTRDYLAEVDEILRASAERQSQARNERDARLVQAVAAGEALTICGRRYVPEPLL